MVGQNLLDHQIDGAFLLGAVQQFSGAFLNTLTVSGRIMEAVDVVDPQPLYLALRQEPEDQLVRRFEQRRHLHAQAGEVVDLEKASIVDFVGGDPPIRDAVVLRFQEAMKGGETAGIARFTRQPLERAFDRRAHACLLRRQLGEPGLDLVGIPAAIRRLAQLCECA